MRDLVERLRAYYGLVMLSATQDGEMEYQFGPGDYVWSACKRCTPVVRVRQPESKTGGTR